MLCCGLDPSLAALLAESQPDRTERPLPAELLLGIATLALTLFLLGVTLSGQ